MDKILSRVKKMLALGNDSAATEGERDTALKMAYNMLARHNLTMVDVDSHEAPEIREKINSIMVGTIWARSIANSVSEMFFCKYFSGAKVNSWKCNHFFVGKQSNATSAMLMSEYIVTSIVREANKRYKDVSSAEGRSFCVGAVGRLRERIRELIESQKSENAATQGTLMVLANLYDSERNANMLFLENSGVRLSKSAKGKGAVNASSFEAGKSFGNGIGLSPQVRASKSNTLRLN